jgi:hypothetical protein
MSKTNNYIIDLHNLTEEVKELKEDRKFAYDTACELTEYLEDTEKEFWELEKIEEYIAVIQNYTRYF